MRWVRVAIALGWRMPILALLTRPSLPYGKPTPFYVFSFSRS
ncbi:hypothetical protein [Coleofasciculus sp. H7-2]